MNDTPSAESDVTGWKAGRYEGIRVIHDSAGRPHEAHFTAAHHRFTDYLSTATSALILDRDKNHVFLRGKAPAKAREQEACARVFRFDLTEDKYGDYQREFSLDDGESRGRLYLDCVEFLQYHGNSFWDVEKTKPENCIIAHQFLVLHVVAENLSSELLQRLSEALAKPRNYVCIDPDSIRTPINEDRYKASLPHRNSAHDSGSAQFGMKILRYFGDLALNLLCDGMVSAGYHRPEVFLTDGAMIFAGKKKKKCPTPEGIRYANVHRPFRVALAIPNSAEEVVPPNRLACPPTTEPTWQWDEQWAWHLATGADRYEELIPRQTAEYLQEITALQSAQWTVLADFGGLGIVRREVLNKRSPAMWALAHTRLVDLAVLQMRVFSYLRQMQTNLATMARFDTDLDRASKIDEQYSLLERAMSCIALVQRDYVEFRNELWFTAVPTRRIETSALRAIGHALQLDQLHQDVFEELKQRQQVYDNHHTRISLKYEQQQDRERRESEEQRRQSQEIKDRNEQVLLAAFAAALAGPAWAEAFEADPPWLVSSLLVGSLTFIVVYVLLYFRRR